MQALLLPLITFLANLEYRIVTRGEEGCSLIARLLKGVGGRLLELFQTLLRIPIQNGEFENA
jgi:hypothetical protein